VYYYNHSFQGTNDFFLGSMTTSRFLQRYTIAVIMPK